jgi:hypothetical protein
MKEKINRLSSYHSRLRENYFQIRCNFSWLNVHNFTRFLGYIYIRKLLYLDMASKRKSIVKIMVGRPQPTDGTLTYASKINPVYLKGCIAEHWCASRK